jgi:hypothetical protein
MGDGMSEQTPQKTTLTINWLQIAGGAGAAVTSAVLLAGLKSLGTYGTLVGAAMGSIIASTAAAVYGHYLNASKDRVVDVARRARDRRTGTVPPVPAPQDDHPEPADPPVPDEGADEGTPTPGPPEPPRRKRFRPVHAVVVGVAAFVLAVGGIFVWEQVSGESVAATRQNSTATVNKGVFGNEVTSSATTTPTETATPTDTATSTETGTSTETSTETSTATDSATAESTETATDTATSTSTRTSTSTSTAQQSESGSEDDAASTPTSSADSSDAALSEPTGTATTAP